MIDASWALAHSFFMVFLLLLFGVGVGIIYLEERRGRKK